jgi:hypothetical protein
MKKNSLTTAVVAGIAGVAGLANVSNAVNLNPDGLGQVLIYPYYTVNGGNNTLISVVNTTDEVKAVKVRFLESLNSREVLDFNLYLSPFDVWTAAVTQSGATGPGRLFTSDRSCTVPAIPAAGVDFRNFAYTGTFDDDGPNTLDRTRDGHIEMIEMGVVVDDEDTTGPAFPLPGAPGNLSGVDNVPGDSGETFASDATHIDGVPDNCTSLIASWANGEWFTNGQTDMDEPTGGLFGGASIVDVANGTNLAYNADAIDGFFTLANNASLHTGPGFTLPTLAQAQTTLGEADAIVFDNGNLITLDFVSGRPDAVSSVYMHDEIYNEFNTEPSLGADSEWVVTFPTKRLHLETTSASPSLAARRRPFANDTDDTGDTTGTPAGNIGGAGETGLFDPNGYCEPINVAYYDREEGPEAPTPIVDFSPQPENAPTVLSLCFEANVVTFNQTAEVTAGASAVLGATRTARNINLTTASGADVNAGWIAMHLGNLNNFLLDGLPTQATPRNQLFGLPVTGFWVANFVNANAAPGVLANYSLLSKHRASRTAQSVIVVNEGIAGETITPTGFAAS